MIDTRTCEKIHETEGPRAAEPFPEETILIIGAGRFGKMAAVRLLPTRHSLLYIVDQDKGKLREVETPRARKICCAGPEFLSERFHLLHSSNVIIPALPVHLAYEWLRRSLPRNLKATPLQVPRALIPLLPHTWEGGDGSLLISYADSLCPDDCPEPEDYCTVTGQKRQTPLHELLNHMDSPGYRVHIVRSRQLAPGVGGYGVRDLEELLGRISGEGVGKWLVGTACRCHGVLTAVELTL
jgi:hypothetical protein